jgi:hypothetical protein
MAGKTEVVMRFFLVERWPQGKYDGGMTSTRDDPSVDDIFEEEEASKFQPCDEEKEEESFCFVGRRPGTYSVVNHD